MLGFVNIFFPPLSLNLVLLSLLTEQTTFIFGISLADKIPTSKLIDKYIQTQAPRYKHIHIHTLIDRYICIYRNVYTNENTQKYAHKEK